MSLRWCICTLYLLTCQVWVAGGDSQFCGCAVSFECKLPPLFAGSPVSRHTGMQGPRHIFWHCPARPVDHTLINNVKPHLTNSAKTLWPNTKTLPAMPKLGLKIPRHIANNSKTLRMPRHTGLVTPRHCHLAQQCQDTLTNNAKVHSLALIGLSIPRHTDWNAKTYQLTVPCWPNNTKTC